jgi:DNA primase
MKGRGFDPDEIVKLWGLQALGLSGFLSWRIFIPIVYHGRMVSWTTRTIGDQEPRYISARPDQELVSIKQSLLGEDYVRDVVIVVEGPFDAMRVGPGAVALFGNAVSPAQIKKLSQIPTRVICLDNETEAQRRACKLCSLLEPFPGRTINVVLDAKDPGSASEHEIQLLRRSFLK